jgi:hypothetical protein
MVRHTDSFTSTVIISAPEIICPFVMFELSVTGVEYNIFTSKITSDYERVDFKRLNRSVFEDYEMIVIALSSSDVIYVLPPAVTQFLAIAFWGICIKLSKVVGKCDWPTV